MIISNRNKIILEDHEKEFIKANFYKMTNRQLADALGLKLTKLRGFAYEMGLKRMKMQYWTPQQVKFLKANYQAIGDTELAEIFEVKWHKEKGWTKKHIEKKRRYLKLKRTAAQRKRIKHRNTQMGRFAECAKKRWETTGVAPIGEKRIWKRIKTHDIVVIKTKSGFVHYNRWLWEHHYGAVPEGMNVVNMSKEPLNYGIEDLKLLTDAENIARNWHNRYPAELKRSILKVNKLKRTLKQKQDGKIKP